MQPRPIDQPTTRPKPPQPTSTWGVSARVAAQYGYPPTRPASHEARIAYLEAMVRWLAAELDAVRGASDPPELPTDWRPIS